MAGSWIGLRGGLILSVLGLAGCTTFGDMTGAAIGIAPGAPVADVASLAPSYSPTTGEQPGVGEATPLVDPTDQLGLGRKHFAEMNYGLAEQHFRRAVEKPTGPARTDAEAWLGLAATYDRLRRFELADRAYKQATRIVGSTPEILNNQGYSYMLRGDFRKARATLLLASKQDPTNSYIQNNLMLLARNQKANDPLR